VTHGIYRAKYQLFRKMIASLDGCNINPATAFPAFLFGNILHGIYFELHGDISTGTLDKMRESTFPYWNSLQTLIEDSPLSELDKYFTVSGLEYLERAYRESRGVIILSYHSTGNRLAITALSRRLNCDPIPTISRRVAAGQSLAWKNSRPGDIPPVASAGLNAGEALRGQHLLKEGKIIQIVNDGYLGGGGISNHRVVVAGRQYFLPTGFAELALNTGAMIVPQYSTTLADAHVHTTFLPPVSTEPGNRDIQIESLMKQYADFLTSSWKAAPESMIWLRIQNHLKHPVD
jgi:phosphatidylinositol dimannoside acyltransferase